VAATCRRASRTPRACPTGSSADWAGTWTLFRAQLAATLRRSGRAAAAAARGARSRVFGFQSRLARPAPEFGRPRARRGRAAALGRGARGYAALTEPSASPCSSASLPARGCCTRAIWSTARRRAANSLSCRRRRTCTPASVPSPSRITSFRTCASVSDLLGSGPCYWKEVGRLLCPARRRVWRSISSRCSRPSPTWVAAAASCPTPFALEIYRHWLEAARAGAGNHARLFRQQQGRGLSHCQLGAVTRRKRAWSECSGK